MKVRNFILIPLSGLIIIGILGTFANIFQSNALTELLGNYSEASHLLSEADRDLYQVKVSEQMVLNNSTDDPLFKEGLDMHADNIKQSEERVNEALGLVTSEKLVSLKTEYQQKRLAWLEKTNKVIEYSKDQSQLEFARKIANGSADKAFTEMRDLIDQVSNELNKMKDSYIDREHLISKALTIGYIVLIVLISLFTYFMSKKFAKPINDLTDLAQKISDGNLNVKINTDYKGEVGVLSKSFKTLVVTLNNVNSEINLLIKAGNDGDLSVRSNSDSFKGDFKVMVDGLNQTLDNIINPLMKVSEFVNRISEGNIPDEIQEEYFGDFDKIKKSLNNSANAIKLLIEDSNELANAANEGKLEFRADLSKHNGDFRKVIQGINNSLDSVIGPLQITSEMIHKISSGNIPPTITEEFQGDYNYLKIRINQLIENLNGVFGQTDYLIKSIIDGNLDARGDEKKFEGAWSNLVEKLNKIIIEVDTPIKEVVYILEGLSVNDYGRKMSDNYKGVWNDLKVASDMNMKRLEHLLDVIIEMSNGNFNSYNELVAIGKRSDNDMMLPAIIQLMRNVQTLIDDINGLTNQALEGNLAYRANADKLQGEYRNILLNINQLLDALNEPITEAGEVLQIMSTGNLAAKMLGNYKGDHETLKNSINNLSNSLSQLILSVLQGVNITTEATERISYTSETISAAAAEQSSQTAEVASAVEEMTRTISENAQGAIQTSEVAKNNGNIAIEGGKIVEQTVQKMRDIAHVVNESANNIEKLGESSKQIGEIISVIEDIADQTNLLALNAAIEAARAGEQGRGFAVVADEVRKLAERTTSATKEISSMIRSIQIETENAVKIMQNGNNEVNSGISLADQAGEALRNILKSSNQVIQMIAQIATANEEQAATSEQISKNVYSISQVAHDAATNINDIANAADELKDMNANLNNLMNKFNVDEDNQTNKFALKGTTNRKYLS